MINSILFIMINKIYEYLLEKYLHYAPTRQAAMERAILAVRCKIPNNHPKKEVIEDLEVEFKKDIKRIRNYFFTTSLLYIIVYANVIFFMFSFARYIEQIIGIMSSLVAAIGTPLFLIWIVFMHYTISVVYQKMDMAATRLIVLYEEINAHVYTKSTIKHRVKKVVYEKRIRKPTTKI